MWLYETKIWRKNKVILHENSTDSFIVCIKTENIYGNIVKKFWNKTWIWNLTDNYLKKKIWKMIGLVKDQLGGKNGEKILSHWHLTNTAV